MKKIFLAAMLLGGLLVSCGGAAEKPLEGTMWKLVSMEGIPAEAVEAEEDAFTLTFDAAEARCFGRTNCNRFFGGYELSGSGLKLGSLGMTRMACPDMAYEDAFVKMLDEVDGYAIARDVLTLTGEGRTLATFRAVEPAAEPAAE